MTNQESQLLLDLRKAGVWDMKGGSFECHVDVEGRIVKIDVHRHFRITPRLVSKEEVTSLSTTKD